ncbi:hypothetical protein BDW66DRAFT_141830 [Aspergillus desertorum]
MAPAATNPERLLRPATDFERWLGENDKLLDSVREYDVDPGANEHSYDGRITITGASDSPEIT